MIQNPMLSRKKVTTMQNVLLIVTFIISLSLINNSWAKEQSGTVQTLVEILDKMPVSISDRYSARNPSETIEFFGIHPGMTVVEMMPGGGWYSKILLQYLGQHGKLIGADYSFDMWKKFDWMTEEMLAANKSWVKDWTAKAEGWRDEKGAIVSAFRIGSVPNEIYGTADVVLFIRALHNLALFESDGNHLSTALKNSFDVLKPGGVVGIVQHMAPESASNKWASGSNGYLKKSFVIKKMREAGFDYVDSSNINVNLRDNPSESDIVWRLPPGFATSKGDPFLKEKYKEIGESTRMTLIFRKPSYEL